MKKIEINDKKIFENYYVDSIINSEYQFSTLFIWQHVYKFKYEMWNDCLIVYGTQKNGDTQVYFPIGKINELDSYVDHIQHIFGHLNQHINIRPLSEKMKDCLLHSIDFNIEVGSKESYSDYLYDFDSLKSYSGSMYKKKRHELHRFCSRYEYKYESIDLGNMKEVLEALNRILNLESERDEDEYEAYCKIFNNFECLNLRGGFIRIRGIIEAVAVGEAIGSMILMHLRRCNKRFEGIYPAMLHLVLNSEFNNGEYKIINTQDDMGNENIRRTKLSYNPVCIYKKYFIKEVNNEKILY